MLKKNLIHILKKIKSGLTEILVHPSGKDSKHFNEAKELQGVISKDTLDVIKNSGIILTNYREMTRA